MNNNSKMDEDLQELAQSDYFSLSLDDTSSTEPEPEEELDENNELHEKTEEEIEKELLEYFQPEGTKKQEEKQDTTGNLICVPNEKSRVLTNGESINIGVYVFPIIDIAVFIALCFIVMGFARFLGVINFGYGIAIMITAMFLHIVLFQLGISPINKRMKKIRRSIIVRKDKNMSIIYCKPNRKVVANTSAFSLKDLAKIKTEISIQKYSTDYLKKNYLLTGRTNITDIFKEEYISVKLLAKKKDYYLFSGTDLHTNTYSRFKVYKAYTDMDKLIEGL